MDPDDLRTEFAMAMSTMYQQEVPLYGNLLDIVRHVNQDVLRNKEKDLTVDTIAIRASAERLTLERHGAIRLGTPHELRTVKRIFAILGMHPVGYYDLSVAGLPMHATCFRPTSVQSLHRNPFRVFTTLLRPDLLADEDARQLSWELLQKRNIFTAKLLEVLDTAETQNGRLTEEQGAIFVPEALRTFSWQAVAAATFDQFNILKAEHLILADIASFQSAHINHLTPRTLDISAVQAAMREAGMAVKARIEGPPIRQCPILLRQTSFLALEEYVHFRRSDGPGLVSASDTGPGLIKASHTARFGEVEERGAAVTERGQVLYERLLQETMEMAANAGPDEAGGLAEDVFKQFPDTWTDLRKEGLIHCEYVCVRKMSLNEAGQQLDELTLERLISQGVVEARPITYEDFLPFSAAGIFQSNIQSRDKDRRPLQMKHPKPDLSGFVEALEEKPVDIQNWYALIQKQSLKAVAEKLGMTAA
ncbi:uncharacterized protein BDZ83DRAFT_584301 [Colletotrichum acutatum]|uniref:2-oxoadipate dioxygenase/decarboxylase n=1 Tax=Glomerella acutata TaxID=27357 RepID=A0AAD8UI36_GLOAC|nr:uncharacterized protein BDZ83DRAFT_584301 [Colletotrichum acutatum]KAK1720415.1 hypothetical protein BDZ83DRAFT_584301 [Colletotrichum acutatum]